jgi:hypothetical protein
MSKITLDSVASGYDLSKINNNFQTIQNELNDKVLYRDNPIGETNTLITAIDCNSKSLYNLPVPTLSHQAATKDYVDASANPSAGSAKAWVRFSVSGGVCTVDAGYNVDSVTYNGVGDYTVNFGTDFASVNYCVTGCCSRGATDNNALFQQHYATPPAAGSCRVSTSTNGGTAFDMALVFCAFFGSQ